MATAVINKSGERLSPKQFNEICGTNFTWNDFFYFDWSVLFFKMSETYNEEIFNKKTHGYQHVFKTFGEAARQYLRASVIAYPTDDKEKLLAELDADVEYCKEQLKEFKKLYDHELRIVSLNIG